MGVRYNVRAIRKAKGITGARVARALGLSRNGYYNIEVENSRLDAEVLPVIANVLGEDVGVFFDDKLTKSVLRRIGKETKFNGRGKGA